jgi:hypothetical protein
VFAHQRASGLGADQIAADLALLAHAMLGGRAPRRA